MSRFTFQDIPSQQGKICVVTGANSGLGFETARALAKKGARVVLACRNPERAEGALKAIRDEYPAANVELLALDLASLASVRKAAAELEKRVDRIDVLINNAGVMAPPYQKTEDGFEMQMGVNHFGHFALTGLLMPLLMRAPQPRVVNVASGMHKIGKLRFHDLAWERKYDKWLAYGMSKLANLLFTYELDRRARAQGSMLIAVAAHPGYAATNLQTTGPEMQGSKLMVGLMRVSNALFGQKAEMGALPQIYAATAGDVVSGQYFGPDGIGEGRGYPKRVRSNKRSRDQEAQGRLWKVSEELTGVRFPSGLAPVASDKRV